MLLKMYNVLNLDLKKLHWKKKNSMEDILAKKISLQYMFYFFSWQHKGFFFLRQQKIKSLSLT